MAVQSADFAGVRLVLFFFNFFFQAEDGIRDLTVTGVQTCALPISFFVLTGTHGAHVSVGVLWLLTLWVRALQGKLTQANAMTVEITGLYWHFVDVVWIVILDRKSVV